ncbi:MAG: translation initiation factor IF-2 N-terminal domain-containing protein, partial [Candidatus Izemoplasmatales bacterium]
MAKKKQVYKRKPNAYVKKKPYVEQRKPNAPVKVEALADVIYYTDGMTVFDFAEALHRPVAEIIKKLMFMKILASQTQTLDRETVELLTMEYGL